MKKLFVVVLAVSCILPACGKKEEGCKLDKECPEGQICRNMKCEAVAGDQASGDVQAAGETAGAKDAQGNAGAADAGKDAKPTGPKELSLAMAGDSKTLKLEDLGLDIDYVLNETIMLGDAMKLEIGPGVTIDMQSSSAGFDVGGDAALIVKGTQTSPVIFKSTNSSVWRGMTFTSANKDNTLEHLQILNADGEEQVIHVFSEGRLGMDHVVIDGSANNGVRFSGPKPTRFTNNTIRNCKGFPLALEGWWHVETIGDGNTYENNRQFIRIEQNTFSDIQNSTIAKQPIPYLLPEGLFVTGESGTLTIQPGVEFVFEHGKEAFFNDSVQIKIEGTPENPVIMRGMSDEPNFWNGVKIETTRPSSVSGLVLSNTGADDNPSMRIRPDANVTLANITFKATDQMCLDIGSDAKIINKGGLTFEKCGKGNIFDNRIDGDDDKKVLTELPVAVE